jgi:hypothetical protein
VQLLADEQPHRPQAQRIGEGGQGGRGIQHLETVSHDHAYVIQKARCQ